MTNHLFEDNRKSLKNDNIHIFYVLQYKNRKQWRLISKPSIPNHYSRDPLNKVQRERNLHITGRITSFTSSICSKAHDTNLIAVYRTVGNDERSTTVSVAHVMSRRICAHVLLVHIASVNPLALCKGHDLLLDAQQSRRHATSWVIRFVGNVSKSSHSPEFTRQVLSKIRSRRKVHCPEGTGERQRVIQFN